MGKNKAWSFFKQRSASAKYKVYYEGKLKKGNVYAKFVNQNDNRTFVRPYGEKHWKDGYFLEKTQVGSLTFGHEIMKPFSTIYFKKEKDQRNIFCYIMDMKNANIMYTFKVDTMEWVEGIIYDKK